MNPDAFEASETAELMSQFGNGSGSLGYDAVDQDMRLKRCGLVWYEDQLSNHRWVSPPVSQPDGAASRVKVLPLYLVKPAPGLEVTATDGQKYILPKGFTGGWFDVKSPTGKALIT